MSIAEQLQIKFGLHDPECKDLRTPANDVIEVTSPEGHFALKLYNSTSRTAQDVQWELELTLHLIENEVSVVKPVKGVEGYLQSFMVEGQSRVGILFEWANGEKPKAEPSTYTLLGGMAAQIHQAADSFKSDLPREKYDIATLIDEQLDRIKQPLLDSGQQQRVYELTERMRKRIEGLDLDWGVCHMDLTLDNVHRHADSLTAFDFDSSGESWRAIEAWGVRRWSEESFQAWLKGYRTVRSFSDNDVMAVSIFGIVADIRNVVWKLGFAKSSRGKPLLTSGELPKVVDEWLDWESTHFK